MLRDMTDDDARAEHYGLDPRALRDAPAGPITLVNLFRLRETAADAPGLPARSGAEALLTYAAVSEGRLAAVGGRFLSRSLAVGALWADGPGWDVVVTAEYPDVQAVRALLDDPAYRAAYEHRRAAVAAQHVIVSASLG